MLVAHITLSHAFKNNKTVTEQMTSNSVLAQVFLAFWTLNPGTASSCSDVWIPACIGKHNILQLIYWGYFAISIIIVTCNNHRFHFSSETWDAALSSLSLSVIHACNDFCVFLWQLPLFVCVPSLFGTIQSFHFLFFFRPNNNFCCWTFSGSLYISFLNITAWTKTYQCVEHEMSLTSLRDHWSTIVFLLCCRCKLILKTQLNTTSSRLRGSKWSSSCPPR